MGTIFKRKDKSGNVSYTARIRKSGYPEKVATFARMTDAKNWVQQEEIKIRQGLYLDTLESDKHTLEEAIDRHAKEFPPSLDRRKHFVRWKERLGKRFLTAVNDIAINDSISYWKRELELAPATLNRHIDSLSVVMNSAKKWGWIRRNPVYEVDRQKEPRGRVRYLSNEEREALLNACKASEYPYLYLIVVLALSTGMRKEELLSLKWRDVDLSAGAIILLKTKNRDRRRVPLRGHALTLLKEHSKVRPINSDFLFPGVKPSPNKDCVKVPANDRHFDIKKPWQRALKAAGLDTVKEKKTGKLLREGFRFHDLRHSCASYLAMNGASLIEIAEVLGHRTLDVVKRYAHLSESHTAGVVEKMNKKIFG